MPARYTIAHIVYAYKVPIYNNRFYKSRPCILLVDADSISLMPCNSITRVLMVAAYKMGNAVL